MFVVTRRAVKLFINIDQSAPLAWVPLCLRDTTGLKPRGDSISTWPNFASTLFRHAATREKLNHHAAELSHPWAEMGGEIPSFFHTISASFQ